MQLFTITMPLVLMMQNVDVLGVNETFPVDCISTVFCSQDSQQQITADQDSGYNVYHRGQLYTLLFSEGPRHLIQEKTEAKATIKAALIAVPTDLPPEFVVDRVIEVYHNVLPAVIGAIDNVFASDSKRRDLQFRVLRSLHIEGCVFYEVRFVLEGHENRVVIGAVDKTVWVISYTSNEEKLTPEQLKEWEAILANLRLKSDEQAGRNK